MPRKKKDPRSSSSILKQYMAGASLGDLKAKFGVRSKGHLASAVLDALIASKKLPPLRRKSAAAEKAPTEFKVAVNKRGTIVLPKDAVTGAFRFKEGQSFTARRRGRKIILTAG